MYRITVVAMLLGLSAAAQAASEKPVVQMDRQAPVAEQVRKVEKALDNSEYAEISADDRAQVRQSLERITLRVGDRQTAQELPPAVQNEVFNDQERINTILTRAHADSRLVCQHTRSHGQQHAQEPLPDRGRTPPDRGKGQGAAQRPAQLQDALPAACRALTDGHRTPCRPSLVGASARS